MRVVVQPYQHLPGTRFTPRPLGTGSKTEDVIVVRVGRGSHQDQRAADGSTAATRIPEDDGLVARDAEVRGHERSHLATLGPYAAGPVLYGYATGPDGESYAVSGAIKVDLSPVPGDPEATLRKARAVRQAALAPGAPSGADMRTAAKAYLLEIQAHRAMQEERQTARSAERLV